MNALVTAQIGYIFNCRNLRKNTDAAGILYGNHNLYIGIFLIVACQVLFTYSPGFQYIFKTESIDGESWGKIIFLAIIVFCAVEFDKFANWFRKMMVQALRAEGYLSVPRPPAKRRGSSFDSV